MKLFVSRQLYWGVDEDDSNVVEIAVGGLDFANPDMLVARWHHLGEGKEFSDPREAVEAAIKVCEAWRQSGEKNAKIAYGATGGNTLPFEPSDFESARKWAQDKYEKLPKCVECGEVLGKEKYGSYELNEYDCCSASCAEKHYQPLESDDEVH